MGDDHQHHPLLLLQLQEQPADAVGGGLVKVAGGLVGQQEHGPLEQGPGQGCPLLLASGELGGAMIQPAAQAHTVQQLAARRAASSLKGPPAMAGKSTFSSTEH